MSIENQLRETMDIQATDFDLGGLQSVGEIAATGKKRLVRNRVLSAAGAFLMVGALLGGFGAFRADESAGVTIANAIDPAELERLERHVLQPLEVHFAGSRFRALGQVLSGAGEPLQPVWSSTPQRSTYVPVSSVDGVNWTIDANAPLITNGWPGLTVFDEGNSPRYAITVVEGSNVVVRTSDDFVTWTKTARPLPDALAGRSELQAGTLTPTSDGGHWINIFIDPARARADEVQVALTDRGIGAESLCELEQVEDFSHRFRACGTNDTVEFAAQDNGSRFEEMAWETIRLTPDGYRIVDSDELPESDTTVGPTVETHETTIWYSADGINHEGLDLAAHYSDQFLPELRASWPVEGPGGWAVTVRPWPLLRPPVTDGPFEITADGRTLRGTANGAAEMVDTDGSVVREWSHFELSNLAWSGVQVNSDGVVIAADDGTTLMALTHDQWADAFAPDRAAHASDIWFSPDGRNWRIIQSTDALVRVWGVGDDEIIIESAGPGDVYATERVLKPILERISVGVAGSGNEVLETQPKERPEDSFRSTFTFTRPNSSAGSLESGVSEVVDED